MTFLKNNMKMLSVKLIIFMGSGLIFLPVSEARAESANETLAVATFVVGKAHYIRNGKEKRIRVKTIFAKNDIIRTEKGTVNIQIGPSAVLKISNYSEVELSKLYEAGSDQDIAVALKQGRLYSKIVKKLNKKSRFRIQTPTVVAGVRGTEFLVSESPKEQKKDDEDKDIPTGVFVNEGSVEAESSDSGEKSDSMTIDAGQQVTTETGAFKQKILDDFIKKKMEIFKKLSVMKEKNYELLKKQKDKNKALMDKIKGK